MKKVVTFVGLFAIGIIVFAMAFFGMSWLVNYVANTNESLVGILNTNFPVFISTMVATMTMKMVTDRIQIAVC